MWPVCTSRTSVGERSWDGRGGRGILGAGWSLRKIEFGQERIGRSCRLGGVNECKEQCFRKWNLVLRT